MRSKREEATISAIDSIKATIQSNFGGKKSSDFTPETIKPALIAVNKPLIALLLGVAPNSKGEMVANARNPRVNGEQALELAAAYSSANIVGILTGVLQGAAAANAAQTQTQTGPQIPVGSNAPQMGVVTANGSITMSPPTDKDGLKQAYMISAVDNTAFTPEMIYQMYTWGEDILVKNPRKKRNTVFKWVGIGSAAAIGGFLIWKLIEAANSKDDIKVIAEDVEVDADIPRVEVDEVDIGSMGHDAVSHASSISDPL